MHKVRFLCWLFFLLPAMAFCQQVTIEGYVYEAGNRGYLNLAKVTVFDKATMALRGETQSDLNGLFQIEVAPGNEYLLRVSKKPFDTQEQIISTKGKKEGEKTYVKFEMKRMPGYIFEVTLAPARTDDDIAVDAITGALIEVYNNTTEKEELVLKNHPQPTFSSRFEQGNHYTLLIRKRGFFNKRLEAYVNVKGCILCFDGVGEVKPGVSDVLTEGLEMGTLLANVEMQPIVLNQEIEIKNIYYDLNSARLKTAARKELDQLVVSLKDNTNLKVEIGSHTDSRGDDGYNKKLSLKRAQSVVKYLTENGIAENRLVPKGYGESQLRNRCDDGVKCSEREHLKNRRTELKVIGFVDPSLVDDSRSLAQIKHEESMEKLLAELENSEIKVAPGEELPADLQAQIDRQGTKQETIPEDRQADPIIVQPGSRKPPKKMTNIPPPPETQTEKMEQSDRQNSTQPPVADFRIKIIKPSNVQENDPPVPAPPYIYDDDEKRQPAIVPNHEVNTLSKVNKPRRLATDFTGYSIEIMRSAYQLPLSHGLFTRHGNLQLEETKEGSFAYMIGDFKKEKEAKGFLKQVLAHQYPDAKVIRYKNGRRLAK